MIDHDNRTPEEEKEHILSQRKPENFATSEPHRQPEARRPPNGIHNVLPFVVAGVLILAAVLILVGAD